ncbi:MAG: LysR family transcriptional regulator [Rhodobacteraceae bacterium]|nr:LysR family transcriptional regulator [Paracoccaceae bacterium]
MDLNQIRYFLNLAEVLNFTEAARMSGISQPSLTKSIQRLEDELGGPVVYRDGKDTRLTALGRDLQVEFMRVQAALDTVSELAEISVLGRRRRLMVGVASTIAPTVLAPFWRHVLAQLPSVELQFHPMLPGESEAEVLSGRYDLCLLSNPPAANVKLRVLPLFDEPLRLAMAAGHPLAAEDIVPAAKLAEETYLDRLHCEFRSQLIRHFMDRNIVMTPRLQSEREDWVQQMVAEGAGVCTLPAHSAIVPGIVLRPVEGLTLSRQVSLVAVSGSGNAKEVRQILTMAAGFAWPA